MAEWIEKVISCCLLPGLGILLAALALKWIEKGKNKLETLYIVIPLIVTIAWFFWQFHKVSQAKDNALTVDDVISIAAIVCALNVILLAFAFCIFVAWLCKYIRKCYVKKEDYDRLFNIIEKMSMIMDKYHPLKKAQGAMQDQPGRKTTNEEE